MLPIPRSSSVLENFSLKGRIAVVTGGNRGIGIEVARGLAEAGADIAIVYRSSKASSDAAALQLSQDYGVKALAYQADVADHAAINAAVMKIVEDFGGLDIAVVNAGIGAEFECLDSTPAQYREQMAVNLDGAWYTAQAAAKVFKTRGKGNIIFTTSMSAVIVNGPEPQSFVSLFDAESPFTNLAFGDYNASKAGLVHLAKSLAVEWISFCRVNCISPGYIATEMINDLPEEWKNKWIADTPCRRFGETRELKGAYVFCASDASSFMTGAQIIIDGGFTLP